MLNCCKVIVTAAFFLLFLPLIAQEKIEREKSVKQNDVHQKAVNWISKTFESPKRVKWYHEISNEGESFEAKLKHRSHAYSVKFDTTGIIMDVEKKVQFREIDQQTRENINDYFKDTYQNYNILKIQMQYTGTSDHLQGLIINRMLKDFEQLKEKDIVLKYEIEYRGKTETEDRLWEGLFDEDGYFLSKRVIILQQNFNVEY